MLVVLIVCEVMMVLLFCFFFFKQKTAYEMRISDWSSDVCSSDLDLLRVAVDHVGIVAEEQFVLDTRVALALAALDDIDLLGHEIGRASCRVRVCQYV